MAFYPPFGGQAGSGGGISDPYEVAKLLAQTGIIYDGSEPLLKINDSDASKFDITSDFNFLGLGTSYPFLAKDGIDPVFFNNSNAVLVGLFKNISVSGAQTSSTANIGEKQISIDSGTGVLKKYAVFYFQGHSENYVCTEDVDTSGGVLKFEPALPVAITDNTPISITRLALIDESTQGTATNFTINGPFNIGDSVISVTADKAVSLFFDDDIQIGTTIYKITNDAEWTSPSSQNINITPSLRTNLTGGEIVTLISSTSEFKYSTRDNVITLGRIQAGPGQIGPGATISQIRDDTYDLKNKDQNDQIFHYEAIGSVASRAQRDFVSSRSDIENQVNINSGTLFNLNKKRFFIKARDNIGAVCFTGIPQLPIVFAFPFRAYAKYSSQYDYSLYTATTLIFHNTSPATITDSNSQFLTQGFKSGDIFNCNSPSNSGQYEIDTVTADIITLKPEYSLTAEPAGSSVTLIVFLRDIFPDNFVSHFIMLPSSPTSNFFIKFGDVQYPNRDEAIRDSFNFGLFENAQVIKISRIIRLGKEDGIDTIVDEVPRISGKKATPLSDGIQANAVISDKMFAKSPRLIVTSDGVNVTAQVDRKQGDILEILFNGISHFVDVSTPDTIQIQDGFPAFALGNIDFSSGFDWGTTNQDFNITVNGVGPTNIPLTTQTTDVATTVSAINTALTTAGVTTVITFNEDNFIGIKSSINGIGQTIILAAGSPDALDTLGINPDTYEGKVSKSYIFYRHEGGVVTLEFNTDDYPREECARIGEVIIHSAAYTQTYGALNVWAWTDSLPDAFWKSYEKMRRGIGAHFNRGCEVGVVTSPITSAFLTVSSGNISQFNPHDTPAIDMQAGDYIYVFNHPTEPYKPILALNDALVDSNNNSLIGAGFNYVLGVAVSEDAGATPDTKVGLFLPSGSYGTGATADIINDINSYSNEIIIPKGFKGVFVYIARVSLVKASNGYWTLLAIKSLTE